MYRTPIGVFCTIVPVVEANGTKPSFPGNQLIILYVAFMDCDRRLRRRCKLIGKTSQSSSCRRSCRQPWTNHSNMFRSATIPISKRCVEKRTRRFEPDQQYRNPLGATVNMDAVSILMSFMIMFFVNACGISVSISMMVIILLANVLLSSEHRVRRCDRIVRSTRHDGRSPAGVMGVYISINTLCDMGATCVNVIGDMAGCVVLQEKIKLKKTKMLHRKRGSSRSPLRSQCK